MEADSARFGYILELLKRDKANAMLTIATAMVVSAPLQNLKVLGHLDKSEMWAHENLVKFRECKCKDLHLDQGNSKPEDRLGEDVIETSPE
ncbi:hypothetical protein TURU_169164 [Turdus rufiventris]|nr:hypothetical protein TURU_169164 [Turdus rufiventris]